MSATDTIPLDIDKTKNGGESSRRRAALFLSAVLITFLAASSAPTPLYRIYQLRW